MKDNRNRPAQNHKYDDMLYMPHYHSPNHPPMPLLNRAAQFSPFAALTGYGEAIDETARVTDRRRELSEEEKDTLNMRFATLGQALAEAGKTGEKPHVEICFFQPDEKKQGGTYRTIPAVVKQIDPVARLLVLTDGVSIPLDDICDINGTIFIEMKESEI